MLTFSGFREDRSLFTTILAMLNTLSHGAEVAVTHRSRLAMFANRGNCKECNFHHSSGLAKSSSSSGNDLYTADSAAKDDLSSLVLHDSSGLKATFLPFLGAWCNIGLRLSIQIPSNIQYYLPYSFSFSLGNTVVS